LLDLDFFVHHSIFDVLLRIHQYLDIIRTGAFDINGVDILVIDGTLDEAWDAKR
jgi:hypothetical protein